MLVYAELVTKQTGQFTTNAPTTETPKPINPVERARERAQIRDQKKQVLEQKKNPSVGPQSPFKKPGQPERKNKPFSPFKKPGQPGQEDKPLSHAEQFKADQEQKRLEREQKNKARQDAAKARQDAAKARYQKVAISDILRTYAEVITAEDGPKGQKLFEIVHPVLTKMGLGTAIEASKTELISGETNTKGDSLFKVTLRRTSEIDDDIINRIKRQDDTKDSFEAMKWTSAGLEMFIWAPYTPPAEVGLPAGI
jgi:hypothetical protein